MWFTVYRAWDLNTNERIIAFYKKELWASHILDTAKLQQIYGTKAYRRIRFRNPWGRNKARIKALVSNAYRSMKKEYGTKAQLWAKI